MPCSAPLRASPSAFRGSVPPAKSLVRPPNFVEVSRLSWRPRRLLRRVRFRRSRQSELHSDCSTPCACLRTRLRRRARVSPVRIPPLARLLSPLLHRHHGSLAGLGTYLKFVHQSPHAGQSKPQASGSRKAVAQSL